MGAKNQVAEQFAKTLSELPREKLEQHFMNLVALISNQTAESQITSIMRGYGGIQQIIIFAGYVAADIDLLLGPKEDRPKFVESCQFLINNLTNDKGYVEAINLASQMLNSYKN